MISIKIHTEKYEKAKEKYLTGLYSITKIAQEFNFCRKQLSLQFKKDNIIVVNKQNMLKFDNTVFDNIDTEEKAYWLGFLYADGYVSNGNRTNNVELSLQLMDNDHLVKYKKFLKAKNNVKIDHFRCRMTVTNKYFREKLIKLGCVNNKSLILTFPDLKIFKEKELIKHFIRGYVDGDGCLCLVKNKKPQIAILGTSEFLNELQKHLPLKKTHKLSKNDYKSISNTFVLPFNGGTAVKIAKFLYEFSEINLTRKFIKYETFLKMFCRPK